MSNTHLKTQLKETQQHLRACQAHVTQLEALLLHQPTSQDDQHQRYSIFDILLEHCHIVSFEWRYLYVNNSAMLYSQRPTNALIGYTMMECDPDIEKTAVFAALQRCMQERCVERIENERTSPDGTSAWFELTIQPVPEGVLILSHDITARKKMEEALHLSEEIFSSAFHVGPAGLTITRIADGKFIDANKAFCEMFEFSRDEVIGHMSTELNMWTPEERQRLIHQQREAGGLHNFELTARSKSGRRVHVLFSSKELQLHGETCHLTTMIDITERKQAEESLRSSEIRFRSLVEAVEDYAIYLLDAGGHVASWNIGAERLKGYQSDEIIGQHFSYFFTPEDRRDNKPAQILADVDSQGRIEDEGWRVRKDGSRFWANVIITALRNADGSSYGFAKITRDLTQRKYAEENIRKLHRTLGVLSDINQSIVRIRPMPSLFEKACEIAVEKGDFRTACIGLFDPNTGRIELATHAGISDNDLKKLISILNTQPLIDAIRAGERLISNDLENDPQSLSWREDALQLGYRASIALPLIVAGEPRGVFNLYADEVGFFDDEELRLMDEMAMDISFAIEVSEQDQQRREAEATVKRYAQRMDILHQIDLGIISATSLQDIVQTALKHIRELIPCQRANVGLIDMARGEGVIFAVDYNNNTALGQGLRIPIGHEFFDGYDANYVRVVPDLRVLQEINPRFKRAVTEGLLSGLNVILRDRDQPIGTLGIFANTVDFFTVEHQEIIVEVGNQLAIAIRQMQLSKELAEHAATLEQKVVERTADLQAAMRRVEAILDNSPDGILLIQRDLSIQQTNSSFNHLFECEWDDYFDKSLVTLIHVDDADVVKALIQSVITEQQGKRVEIRALRKNGSIFDAELSIGLIKGDGLVCALHDITERKAQERQLRYDSSIQESVSDAVIATDMDFRIQSWNRAAEMIYGWSATEAIGKSVNDISQTTYESDEDRARILQDFFERGAWQGEVIQRHQNGSPIHILASVNLFKDDMGQPIGVVSVNRDITERKRVAEVLQKSAAEIRDLYNNAPCGYHSIDKDGLVVQMNDTELQWLGYTRDEVVGKLKITDIFTPESVEVFRKAFPAFRERGWINDLEFDIVRKDGSIIHILLNGTAIYDNDGQYLQSRSTLFDITELKQAQQVIIESEGRYRLLAENISDVIDRTNVQGIRTFITPSCYALLGYTPDELIGQSSINIVHPDDRSDAVASIKQTVSEGKTALSFARRFLHKAGHHIWVEVTNNIIYDPDTGRPVEIIGVIRDITERKHTETVLQSKMDEERQFQANLKALHEIIIELTGIEHLDTFYKRAVELGRERLGLERLAMFLYDEQDDNAIGTFGTDTQGHVVDERGVRFKPDPNGIMRRSFERLERFYFNEQTTLYHDEVPVGNGWNVAAVLWNGTRSLGWFVADNLLSHTPASKLLLDILGLYALSVGTLLAQKQTQIALRESESLYRLLADNISDLVMHSTLTSECLYLSPSIQTLLGYTPQELIGQQTFNFIHPDDQAIIGNAYALSLEQHNNIPSHRYRARHKAGHYVWLETVGRILYAESTNEVLGIITSSRDITARMQAEDALRESEEKFRRLLDAAPIATVISDETGHITVVNVQAETLFGYSRSELIGQMIETLVPGHVREKRVHNRAAYLSTPRVRPMGLGLELFARRKNASEFPVEIQLSHIETSTGLLVMSFVVDITERKRVADELERQRSFLRDVIDVSPSMIFVRDYDGRFVLVNPLFAKMYNTTVENLIGKVDADFNPHIQEVNSFLETDRQVITSGERHYIEEPVTNSSGGTRWLQTTKVPIVSADGRSKYVLGIASDITERRHAEEALRESEAKYRSLVETMRGGLAMFDSMYRITYVNDRFSELLGYSRDEAIGKRPTDFVEGVNLPYVQAQLDRRQLLESTSYEIPLQHKDGRTVHILMAGTPLIDKDGKYNGSLVVATDITMQKQAEETLRQALAKEKELGDLKTRFVSMASHEFRTPLATILALNETLSAYRHRLPEDQIVERFDKIKEQVNHLKDIMEDVLLLARMQARRVEFNPVQFDLDDLCRSVLDEFQKSDATHLIEYSSDPALQRVRLDKKLMRQVINNLITNAIKYSPSNKTIQVSLSYVSDVLVLTVSDQGIGIPEADLGHLFEPFHRAANVGTISGTGLGLVIIKEAVELHNGTISVESQIDVGTTFTVRIPLPLEKEPGHDKNSG